MSLALPSNLFFSFWHLHFQKLNMERSQRKSVDAVHLTETLEMSACWAWVVIMWWVHYVSKISCRLMLEERNRSCRVRTKSIVGKLWHLLTWKQSRFLYILGEMLNQLSKCLRCSGHRFEWITQSLLLSQAKAESRPHGKVQRCKVWRICPRRKGTLALRIVVNPAKHRKG